MLRIGIGYDSHRFEAGRPLVLGGQRIPSDAGLAGHSDADVVTHALIDALLGAAGAGNIGLLFPDKDPRWKNADSLQLLRATRDHLRDRDCHPQQADITIIAERPKLGGFLDAMGATLAAHLDLEPGRISVKAKTNEGMGFLGRGEGIAALAVATVEAR